jgi:hypothetical protein
MGEHVQGRDFAFFVESRAIPIFLLTTLLISSVFYFLIIKSGHMGGDGWGAYVAGLMWSPGFAALLTCKLLRRDLGGIGWGWGETRYEVIGYLIPLGYSVVIYGFVWLTGLGGFIQQELRGSNYELVWSRAASGVGEHHTLFHFHGDFHCHTRFLDRDR